MGSALRNWNSPNLANDAQADIFAHIEFLIGSAAPHRLDCPRTKDTGIAIRHRTDTGSCVDDTTHGWDDGPRNQHCEDRFGTRIKLVSTARYHCTKRPLELLSEWVSAPHATTRLVWLESFSLDLDGWVVAGRSLNSMAKAWSR